MQLLRFFLILCSFSSKDQITDKDVLSGLENGQVIGGNMVDSCWSIVRYVADVLHALVPQQAIQAPARASSPPWEGEVMIPQDPDIDWMEDLTHDDDDDSGGDESVSPISPHQIHTLISFVADNNNKCEFIFSGRRQPLQQIVYIHDHTKRIHESTLVPLPHLQND